MKSTRFGFVAASFLIVSTFQLQAADSTNPPASFQESWESISNRWGSLPLEQTKQAAETNEVTAQYYLAIEYSYGNEFSRDQGEAFKWMQLAAQQGMARAQRWLGWMFQSGLGIEANMDEAKKWYEKAAQQGDVQAEISLGWTYTQGDLARRNYALAEKWIRQAAEQGSADAQYQFGYLLTTEFDKDGHQIQTDFPAAGAEWLRKAAEQGHAKAQYQLAEIYNNGKLGDDQRSNCIPWYLKAAALGNDEAKAEVGELSSLYPNNELLKSVNNIEILRQSGEQGNLDAQFQLAKRYQTGIGVPKDAVEAFKWMQKAAQNDKSSSRVDDAMYYLALMYEKGEGVIQDLAQAHSLFLEAAAVWQADASARVGQMYEKGDGVPQDDHKAMGFYLNLVQEPNHPDTVNYESPGDGAVEGLLNLWSQGRGFPDDNDKGKHGYRDPNELIQNWWQPYIITPKAEFYTGQIYYQGKLVPQDLVEAAARIHVAANQNLDDAQKMLVQVESEMSADQKAAEKSRLDVLEKNFEQAKMTYETTKKAKEIMPW